MPLEVVEGKTLGFETPSPASLLDMTVLAMYLTQGLLLYLKIHSCIYLRHYHNELFSYNQM